jgi:hypothetical protein
MLGLDPGTLHELLCMIPFTQTSHPHTRHTFQLPQHDIITGPLQLKPAQLTTALTAASSSLSYSWHISSASSGPYDTQAMAFVARKALNTSAPFPLSDWEFFGYTSLVEVEGFVVVQNPGNYSLAVSSKDKFILWLQDKWLAMRVIGEAGPGLGLDADVWTAGVLFTQPGELQRLMQLLGLMLHGQQHLLCMYVLLHYRGGSKCSHCSWELGSAE